MKTSKLVFALHLYMTKHGTPALYSDTTHIRSDDTGMVQAPWNAEGFLRTAQPAQCSCLSP